MDHFFTGIKCLKLGLQDLFSSKLQIFVIIPLLVNVLVFGALFYWAYNYLMSKLAFLNTISLPHWLSWLKGFMSNIQYLLVSVALIFAFSIFAYISTLIANILACPFNGYLSEIYSRTLGHTMPISRSLFKLLRDALMRQGAFLKFILPKAILVGLLCVILNFIPVFNLVTPVIFYWFFAYSLTMQYLDYPADNFHVSFQDLLTTMKNNRQACLGYGLSVALLSSIPFINLLVMPVAVLGATRLWHKIKVERV